MASIEGAVQTSVTLYKNRADHCLMENVLMTLVAILEVQRILQDTAFECSIRFSTLER